MYGEWGAQNDRAVRGQRRDVQPLNRSPGAPVTQKSWVPVPCQLLLF